MMKRLLPAGGWRRAARLALACALSGALSAPLFATPAAARTVESICHAFAQGGPPPVRPARFAEGLAEDQVGVTYVGHATFLIETAAGVAAATDYAGASGGVTPTLVTMNNAHITHFTPSPDPAIAHVLRGWPQDGAPAAHDLVVEDLRVRNVTTDIRRGAGVAPDGNSIFVFEIAGLCIGHLGHLHHIPTDAQFGEIGFLDVVMAPVDGSVTMSISDMVETLKRLRARVVIPMHAFSPSGLERFLSGMSEVYEIARQDASTLIVSRASLPDRPTVLVAPPLNPGFGGGGFLP